MTDLFASGERRGRGRPGRAPPDFDSVALFVGGDHGDIVVDYGDGTVVGDAVGAPPGPGRLGSASHPQDPVPGQAVPSSSAFRSRSDGTGNVNLTVSPRSATS